MNTSSTTKQVKVAISFLNRRSDANLVIASGRIIASMTGNATYPTPVPTLASITTARTTYVSAVNALDRGKESTMQRNAARAAMVQLLRSLALYVQQTCEGNLVALSSSGFTAQKGRGQPVGVLSAPQNVRLRQAKVSGQMRALCDRVNAATSYQWRYASALTPTVWTQPNPSPSAGFMLENLTPGTQYIAQVRVFGTQGPSNWSATATLMSM